MKQKIYKNALRLEKITKLTVDEKQEIVIELLKDKSERQLGEELGIPHSTIHDWKTLRQDNTGKNIHVSLATIVRKLREFEPQKEIDYVFLKNIKYIVSEKLRKRN